MNYSIQIQLIYSALDHNNMDQARGIFEQLFASVETRLKNYLVSKHGRRWYESQGADIIQTAAMHMWKALLARGYDLSKNASFPGWCLGILHNKYKDSCRNSSRKKLITVAMLSEPKPAHGFLPDENILQNEQVQVIMEKVMNLPQLQRDIVLDKISGLSGAETARRLGLTTVRVSREFHAARESLSGSIF